MGHRRHSQPRRGSLAYLPKGRAKSMEARIRTWPEDNSDEPKLLADAGFKAGCVQIVSIDDREKTPNHGKQLVSLGTVIVTPPVLIIGVRGYSKDHTGLHADFDFYADDLPKHISRLFKLKTKKNPSENTIKSLKNIKEIYAIIAVTPRNAGLEQKKPYVFEVAVKGGNIEKQFDFVNELLGKEVKIDQDKLKKLEAAINKYTVDMQVEKDISLDVICVYLQPSAPKFEHFKGIRLDA